LMSVVRKAIEKDGKISAGRSAADE
jgi:hypothetical protein